VAAEVRLAVQTATSPLRDWLERHELGPDKLAILSGIDVREVYRATAGLTRRIPSRILEAVASLDGIEAARALESQYETWRLACAESLRQELATSGRP
jgi:hypothetical protein